MDILDALAQWFIAVTTGSNLKEINITHTKKKKKIKDDAGAN